MRKIRKLRPADDESLSDALDIRCHLINRATAPIASLSSSLNFLRCKLNTFRIYFAHWTQYKFVSQLRNLFTFPLNERQLENYQANFGLFFLLTIKVFKTSATTQFFSDYSHTPRFRSLCSNEPETTDRRANFFFLTCSPFCFVLSFESHSGWLCSDSWMHATAESRRKANEIFSTFLSILGPLLSPMFCGYISHSTTLTSKSVYNRWGISCVVVLDMSKTLYVVRVKNENIAEQSNC